MYSIWDILSQMGFYIQFGRLVPTCETDIRKSSICRCFLAAFKSNRLLLITFYHTMFTMLLSEPVQSNVYRMEEGKIWIYCLSVGKH